MRGRTRRGKNRWWGMLAKHKTLCLASLRAVTLKSPNAERGALEHKRPANPQAMLQSPSADCDLPSERYICRMYAVACVLGMMSATRSRLITALPTFWVRLGVEHAADRLGQLRARLSLQCAIVAMRLSGKVHAYWSVFTLHSNKTKHALQSTWS